MGSLHAPCAFALASIPNVMSWNNNDPRVSFLRFVRLFEFKKKEMEELLLAELIKTNPFHEQIDPVHTVIIIIITIR